MFPFAEEPFTIHVSIPTNMPSGNGYQLDVRNTDLVMKRHFRSKNSHEMYFEITRYHTLRDISEAYSLFTDELQKQFEVIDIEPLQPTEVGGRTALEFRFSWTLASRQAVFIEQPDALYRIIYDPELPLNLQILDTVTFST
jgi:hypothetical protein